MTDIVSRTSALVHFHSDFKRLGAQLKAARQVAGRRQVEISRLFERDQSWISRVEAGERRVDVFELRALADIYGVTVEALLDHPDLAVRGNSGLE